MSQFWDRVREWIQIVVEKYDKCEEIISLFKWKLLIVIFMITCYPNETERVGQIMEQNVPIPVENRFALFLPAVAASALPIFELLNLLLLLLADYVFCVCNISRNKTTRCGGGLPKDNCWK